jgi:hypothetical protein
MPTHDHRRALLPLTVVLLILGCSPPERGSSVADTQIVVIPGPIPAATQFDATLPKYEVLEKVRAVGESGWGVIVEVLVSSLRRTTPTEELERIARGIAAQEEADEVLLYRTRSGFEANVDAEYGRRNPGALREGYLGMWIRGTFKLPMN